MLMNKTREPIQVRKSKIDKEIIDYIVQYKTIHCELCKKIIEFELK